MSPHIAQNVANIDSSLILFHRNSSQNKSFRNKNAYNPVSTRW